MVRIKRRWMKMSTVSKEQLFAIANTARIEIRDEEVEKYCAELERMLAMVSQLDEVDTTNVERTTHVFMQENVLRDDEAEEGLPLEKVLKNVPDHEDGHIKVPAILE